MGIITNAIAEIEKILDELKNCKPCARRRATLKRQLRKLLKQQKDEENNGV